MDYSLPQMKAFAIPKPAACNSVLASHVGDSSPSTWVTMCCHPWRFGKELLEMPADPCITREPPNDTYLPKMVLCVQRVSQHLAQ